MSQSDFVIGYRVAILNSSPLGFDVLKNQVGFYLNCPVANGAVLAKIDDLPPAQHSVVVTEPQ